MHALKDKDAGCDNNTIIIIFIESMLCARCCGGTLEHYYLIHRDQVVDEEMNLGELGGLAPMSTKW